VTRRQAIELVDEAVCAGARVNEACRTVGISTRTLTRWRDVGNVGDARQGPRTPVPHRLTEEEETEIVRLANSADYRNLSCEQVVAKLADAGRYICSESSLRRILKRRKQATHRQRCQPAVRRHKPREYVASAPLTVLTWDITYLRNARVRGGFFYLYLFQDVWSRRIVGWQVHTEQSAELAADCLRELCERERIETKDCVLHSDNGAPMKGSTMLTTLNDLGITKSFSRPAVSDDNPYVESLFRHLKYAPSYPTKGFTDLEEARTWVRRFTTWYNHEHLHSSIGLVTPTQRHDGTDIALLERRRALYAEAMARNPRRWTTSHRKWSRPVLVRLNPDRAITTSPASQVMAA